MKVNKKACKKLSDDECIIVIESDDHDKLDSPECFELVEKTAAKMGIKRISFRSRGPILPKAAMDWNGSGKPPAHEPPFVREFHVITSRIL